MYEPRFTDPELTAIWYYLRPVSARMASTSSASAVRRRTPDAQAVAAREGLDLGAELERVVRRKRPGSSAPRPARRSDIGRLIAELAPRLRRDRLRERTDAWMSLGLAPDELDIWMRALGVDGTATASACMRWSITAAALEVVLDGRQVRRYLRDGVTVTAVLALAAERGLDLAASPPT
ncbi:hypothetical protein [Streptomyces prunicolor]|uniref:hypothetical protein n=1 Tax=Streptomyces prunicolor TaxID=67348 RepID=UPI0003799139|nr:hypothetical protein [Streptomyces prunicolor]